MNCRKTTRQCTAHTSPAVVFYSLTSVQDMTWEDREKVLRMLFSSLRRQRQEPVQPPAPKPSYESDDDEVDNPGPLRGIMHLAGPAQLA